MVFGDIYRIINGYDDCANVCGRDNKPDKDLSCKVSLGCLVGVGTRCMCTRAHIWLLVLVGTIGTGYLSWGFGIIEQWKHAGNPLVRQVHGKCVAPGTICPIFMTPCGGNRCWFIRFMLTVTWCMWNDDVIRVYLCIFSMTRWYNLIGHVLRSVDPLSSD